MTIIKTLKGNIAQQRNNNCCNYQLLLTAAAYYSSKTYCGSAWLLNFAHQMIVHGCREEKDAAKS